MAVTPAMWTQQTIGGTSYRAAPAAPYGDLVPRLLGRHAGWAVLAGRDVIGWLVTGAIARAIGGVRGQITCYLGGAGPRPELAFLGPAASGPAGVRAVGEAHRRLLAADRSRPGSPQGFGRRRWLR